MASTPAPPGYPQDIPGLEFAGEVDELARKCAPETRPTSFRTTAAALRRSICRPGDHLAEVPANLDWGRSSGRARSFHHAHDALFTRANLRPGETMLVHAAGSGVGTAAIQLTRAAGAGPSVLLGLPTTRAGEAIWIKRSGWLLLSGGVC